MSKLGRVAGVLVAVGAAIALGVALSLANHGSSGQTSESAAAATTVASVPPTPVVYLPIAVFQQSADLEMVFTAAPGVAGRNDVNFYLRDVDGDDRPYTAMSARFGYLDGRLPAAEQHPVQLHDGHWPLDQLDLALAGHWRIETTVSRDGLPDAHFTFEITLPHR